MRQRKHATPSLSHQPGFKEHTASLAGLSSRGCIDPGGKRAEGAAATQFRNVRCCA